MLYALHASEEGTEEPHSCSERFAWGAVSFWTRDVLGSQALQAGLNVKFEDANS